jgi:hypothetical protein
MGGAQRGQAEVDGACNLWSSFSDKPNTVTVLLEKARIVASLITMNCDGTQRAVEMLKDALGDATRAPFGENDARRVMAETAVLLIRIADQCAFEVLESESREILMDELEMSVGLALEKSGVELAAFAQLLSERMLEYVHYQAWLPGETEVCKGTLLWEFGKKIGAIVDLKEHALFNV